MTTVLVHRNGKMRIYEVQGLTQYESFSKRFEIRAVPQNRPESFPPDSYLRINVRRDGTTELGVRMDSDFYIAGISVYFMNFLLKNCHGKLVAKIQGQPQAGSLKIYFRDNGFKEVEGDMVLQNDPKFNFND